MARDWVSPEQLRRRRRPPPALDPPPSGLRRSPAASPDAGKLLGRACCLWRGASLWGWGVRRQVGGRAAAAEASCRGSGRSPEASSRFAAQPWARLCSPGPGGPQRGGVGGVVAGTEPPVHNFPGKSKKDEKTEVLFTVPSYAQLLPFKPPEADSLKPACNFIGLRLPAGNSG